MLLGLLTWSASAAAYDLAGSRAATNGSDPRSWRGFSVDLRGVVQGILGERGLVIRAAPDHRSNASRVLVDFGGDGALRFSIPDSEARRLLGDAGAGLPEGGRAAVVRLPAGGAADVLAGVVNTRGVVEARSLVIHGGVARLLGGATTTAALPDGAVPLAPPTGSP